MSVAAALGAADVHVQDQYLNAAQLKALRDCVLARRVLGGFHAAKVGSRETLRRDAAVRGDATCWLSEPLYPAERELLERLEELRLTLNRELFLGLFDLELHYAWYPPGTAYERHVDQPLGNSTRLVSLVLYLNDAWSSDAGGQLRFYEKDGTLKDIAPLGGRLVCFRTPGREHGVLPAHRDRFSLSGWFRVRG
jgi:SM-20-related protein